MVRLPPYIGQVLPDMAAHTRKRTKAVGKRPPRMQKRTYRLSVVTIGAGHPSWTLVVPVSVCIFRWRWRHHARRRRLHGVICAVPLLLLFGISWVTLHHMMFGLWRWRRGRRGRWRCEMSLRRCNAVWGLPGLRRARRRRLYCARRNINGRAIYSVRERARVGDNRRGVTHGRRRWGKALSMGGGSLGMRGVVLRGRLLLLLLVLLENLVGRYLVDHFFRRWLRDVRYRRTRFRLRLMVHNGDDSESRDEIYHTGTGVKGATHFS